MKFPLIQNGLSGRSFFRHLLLAKVTRFSDMKLIQKSAEKENEILPLYKKALLYGNEICIKDYSGAYTYSSLHHHSKRLSRQISNICDSGSSSTVGLFCSYDILTILIVWASWMSGQKVLILNRGLKVQQFYDLVKETKVRLIISSDFFEEQSKKLSYENDIPLIHINHKFLCNDFMPEITNHFELLDTIVRNEALFVYSKEIASKTNIVLTHKELCAKVKKKLQTWPLSKTDKILYLCPSYQRYSEEFILSLSFSLSVGSLVNIIIHPFDSKAAWLTILGINIASKDRVNVLIAEPKVYQQLILEYEKIFARDKRVEEYIKDYCHHNIRFSLSCFYEADATVSSNWFKITGLCLQECRFPMENFIGKVEEDNTSVLENQILCISHVKNLLSDQNFTENEKFPILHIAIIGRLMVLNQDELFNHTGKTRSYYNGFFRTIGRYFRYSNC